MIASGWFQGTPGTYWPEVQGSRCRVQGVPCTSMRITRRHVLAIGAGAAATAVGRWPLLAQTAPLITKRIASSKEAVPVIGLGTRNYRAGRSPDARAPFRDKLKAFVE